MDTENLGRQKDLGALQMTANNGPGKCWPGVENWQTMGQSASRWAEGEGECECECERELLTHLIKVQDGEREREMKRGEWRRMGRRICWCTKATITQSLQTHVCVCVFVCAQMQMQDGKWQRKRLSYTERKTKQHSMKN